MANYSIRKISSATSDVIRVNANTLDDLQDGIVVAFDTAAIDINKIVSASQIFNKSNSQYSYLVIQRK